MKLLSLSKLSQIKALKIDYIENWDEVIKDFLKSLYPDTLEKVIINQKYYKDSIIQFSYYAKSLNECFNKTKKLVHIENFEISSEDLWKIIKSCRGCEKVIISYSKLNISDDLDFSIDSKYYIKELSFFNCGLESRSNWNHKNWELKSILKAISSCSLRQSLTKVDLRSEEGYLSSMQNIWEMVEQAKLSEFTAGVNNLKAIVTNNKFLF